MNGLIIPNNSYIAIRNIGSTHSSYLLCHTDLTTCCSSGQGHFRGDWYFPNGTRFQFSGDINEARTAQRVELRRNQGISPTGIYHCTIPSNAIHNESDIFVRDSLFVGLYAGEGIG